jgi:CheY-like chemotaxis protein
MGRVLVIEEDAEVRRVLLEMLKRCGHDVGIAGDCVNPEVPQESDLRCCDGFAAPDVAVIAAITGRRCSGIEAALMILAKWPTTKVLLISASPIEAWPASDRNRVRNLPIHSYAFLPKPFTVSDVREAVEHLIG